MYTATSTAIYGRTTYPPVGPTDNRKGSLRGHLDFSLTELIDRRLAIPL